MISGYVYYGCEREVIKLFEEMCERRIIFNVVIFVVFLFICRYVGLVEFGEKFFYIMERDYGI